MVRHLTHDELRSGLPEIHQSQEDHGVLKSMKLIYGS